MSSPTIEVRNSLGNVFSGISVQSIEWTVGQRYPLEPIQPSMLTFTGWYPNGFSSPNSGVTIGEVVKLYINGSLYWRGRISDVSLEYGVPYASSTGNADFITVQVESDLSNVGRGGETLTAAGTIPLYDSNIAVTTVASYINGRGADVEMSSDLDGSLANRNWTVMELLQSAQFTYQMFNHERPDDIIVGGRITFLAADNPDYLLANTVNFSDTTNNSTNQRFEMLTVDSLAQNYYTSAQITRDATGYLSQVNNSGSRQVTIVENSIAPSDEFNDDLAEWLYNTYSSTAFDITSITCLSEAQNNWNLLMGTDGWNMPGTTSTVTFRGTTQRVVILGFQMSATTESSRFTYFVAPDRYYNMFTLDSSEYGVLDEDRLGYY